MAKSKQNLVGQQVRRLRMEAGLSQEAFSAKLQLVGWDLSRGGHFTWTSSNRITHGFKEKHGGSSSAKAPPVHLLLRGLL